MTKTYRTGAVGALMDEYERAAAELILVIESISDEEYARIRDTKTQDEDCRSIQTIMTHVIRAGYGYYRDAWGVPRAAAWDKAVPRPEVPREMEAALRYMADTLEGRWDLSEQEAVSMKLPTRWGQVYDFEQLFEHAIVHVLRHRRQIERFLGR